MVLLSASCLAVSLRHYDEIELLGSTIKHDHSDSVIAYYTRWYTAHSVPTFYFRLSLHHVS